MVARDVDDWDEDSNTYNTSIELYKHDSKIVGVCDVKDLIIEEIKKFLTEKGYDATQFEILQLFGCYQSIGKERACAE